MKILFLTDPTGDYFQSMLFHGLVSVLGAENVADYPESELFRSAATEGHRAIGLHPMSYLDLDLPSRAGAELGDLASWADAVVAGSVRETARANLAKLPVTASPVAAVDAQDDQYIRGLVRQVDLYFKRETLARGTRLRLRMPARKAYHALTHRDSWLDPATREVAVAHVGARKVRPLPLAMIDRGFVPTDGEKEWDVVFTGAPTDPLRRAIVEQLRGLRAEGLRVHVPDDPAWGETKTWTYTGRLSWVEYMELLSSSRIGVSVRGLGYDTRRYWEIPYAGALLLSEHLPIVIPDDFVDGREAAFAAPDAIAATARRLLDGDTHAIARAGREKLLQAHTSVARARTVVAALEAQ